MQNPNEIFVDKFYTADVATEEIFPSGAHLKDMMVVLIADFEHRVLTTGWMSETDYDRAKERNRWCRVLDIRHHNGAITFVGAYEDGTMRIRTHPIGYGWLVKKDSLDVPYTPGLGFDKDSPDWVETTEATRRPDMIF